MRILSPLFTFLVISNIAQSASTQDSINGYFSIGAFGGKAWTIEDSVARGSNVDYYMTRFGNGETIGINMGYIWNVFPFDSFGVELMSQDLKFDFSEQGIKIGKIHATPIMLLAKYQKFPRKRIGWGSHFDLGIGIVFSDFDAGPIYPAGASSVIVDMDESIGYTLAGGLDYFFTRHLAATATVRMMWSSIECTWTNVGGTKPGPYDLNEMRMWNAQFLIGLQGYF